MTTPINSTVLMSGVDYFDDQAAINPFMSADNPIDRDRAKAEHNTIRDALRKAGVNVIQVEPPAGCQDGVYTANWALVRGNKAVLSSLPNARKGEEAYAEQVLRDLGKTVTHVPEGMRFSGQGDALPAGKYLFAGSNYRSDHSVHAFLAKTLGYEVISLQTLPKRTWYGRAATNRYSGWPDSFFYDIDLALAVLTPSLIAWCPEAFTKASQDKIRAVSDIKKIEVSFADAKLAFACNLVSTGKTVIMSDKAPDFEAAVKAHGLKVVTPRIHELAKGGGYIRCTTLTLDNPA